MSCSHAGLVDASRHMFFIETGGIRYTVHEASKKEASKRRREGA